jgi:hypothetical protein
MSKPIDRISGPIYPQKNSELLAKTMKTLFSMPASTMRSLRMPASVVCRCC